MTKLNGFVVNLKGSYVQVFRISNDVNGNPRYLIHYLNLGLEIYESTKQTRKAGFKIYRGKNFDGGFVFSSYSVESDINQMYKMLHGMED